MFETIRKTSFARAGRAALVLGLVAGVAACDSDSTGSDHSEPRGLEVVDEATEAVLVSVNAARQVNGNLTVPVGGERAIEVYFLDEDGDRFQPSGEFSLDWTVANESVAEIGLHDGHLDMEGVAAGNTTVTFDLMHGGHADYTSPAIPIVVQ